MPRQLSRLSPITPSTISSMLATLSAVTGSRNQPKPISAISAVPTPDPERRERPVRIILQGDPPSPANPPSGCRFHTRCWKAQSICAQVDPPLEDQGGGQLVACHFPSHLSDMSGTVEVSSGPDSPRVPAPSDGSQDFIQSDGPFGSNPTGYED